MSLGSVFAVVAFHLPLLAVLITGWVLIGRQRHRIGPRSTFVGRLGLAFLMVGTALQAGWTMALPWLFQATDNGLIASMSLLSSLIGLLLSLFTIVGIGLLIAALVTRGAPAEPPANPAPPRFNEFTPVASTDGGAV